MTSQLSERQGNLKRSVRDFWETQACGEAYAIGDELRERFDSQAKQRYELEPYIFECARFAEGAGCDVLEIGVGMGADHLLWAQSKPRSLVGVDLTERAIRLTRKRLQCYGLTSNLQTADAECLPFEDDSFDIVYSWGVLHHSPDTPQAIREVHRVLRPGGSARIMIYHTHSLVGYALWLRYALLAGQPGRSLREIYAVHLESPGTKAYDRAQTAEMFDAFAETRMQTALSVGDLMEGAAGQRHRGALLALARRVWPRWLIRKCLAGYGLFLMIEATKSLQTAHVSTKDPAVPHGLREVEGTANAIDQ